MLPVYYLIYYMLYRLLPENTNTFGLFEIGSAWAPMVNEIRTIPPWAPLPNGMIPILPWAPVSTPSRN